VKEIKGCPKADGIRMRSERGSMNLETTERDRRVGWRTGKEEGGEEQWAHVKSIWLFSIRALSKSKSFKYQSRLERI